MLTTNTPEAAGAQCARNTTTAPEISNKKNDMNTIRESINHQIIDLFSRDWKGGSP